MPKTSPPNQTEPDVAQKIRKLAPDKRQRDLARAVLQYYVKQANALLRTTDDEDSARWADGLETVIELLKDDPVQTMDDYLAEYKAGHDEDEAEED